MVAAALARGLPRFVFLLLLLEPQKAGAWRRPVPGRAPQPPAARRGVVDRALRSFSAAAIGVALAAAGPRPAPVAARTLPQGVGGEAGRPEDLARIVELQGVVAEVAALVRGGDAAALKRAQALLAGTETLASRKAFEALFDAYSDRVSAKTRAMNSVAFVTYYEEARYNDTRLEDKEPTRQALQYQFRNEAWIALDNLQAELAYLGSSPGADEGDAVKYAAALEAAFVSYLKLAPEGDVAEVTRALRR
mmetsp:Transcript_17984/g.55036  ORF Transcript_17984/g.55036 Transcript_17984/m.55036 type:complete len:249 (-) Transcript_17984:1366-2112(-)